MLFDSLKSNERLFMNKLVEKEDARLHKRQTAALRTPTDLKVGATKDIAGAMNGILADVFADRKSVV